MTIKEQPEGRNDYNRNKPSDPQAAESSFDSIFRAKKLNVKTPILLALAAAAGLYWAQTKSTQPPADAPPPTAQAPAVPATYDEARLYEITDRVSELSRRLEAAESRRKKTEADILAVKELARSREAQLRSTVSAIGNKLAELANRIEKQPDSGAYAEELKSYVNRLFSNLRNEIEATKSGLAATQADLYETPEKETCRLVRKNQREMVYDCDSRFVRQAVFSQHN